MTSLASATETVKPPVAHRKCVFGKEECGPAGKALWSLIGLISPKLAKATEIIQIPGAQSGPLAKVIPAINQICREQKITGLDLVKYIRARFADAGIEKTPAEVGSLLQKLMTHRHDNEKVHTQSELAIKQELQTQGIDEDQFEYAARFIHEFFAARNHRANGTLIAPNYEADVANHLKAQDAENTRKGIKHLDINPPELSDRSRNVLKSMSAPFQEAYLNN